MRSKRLLLFAAALLSSVAVFAQGFGDSPSVSWKVSSEPVSGQTYKLTFSGRIEEGKHIYGIHPGIGNPVEVEYNSADVTAAPLKEELEPVSYKEDLVFFKKAVFSQEVTVPSGTSTVDGTII